jgi:aminobenzoyl-glutamate utilization protein B
MISKRALQVIAVGLVLGALTAPALAEQEGAKTVANEAIDRNAEQIATIGDTVYYFGELGMQEVESAKFMSTRRSTGFLDESHGPQARLLGPAQ